MVHFIFVDPTLENISFAYVSDLVLCCGCALLRRRAVQTVAAESGKADGLLVNAQWKNTYLWFYSQHRTGHLGILNSQQTAWPWAICIYVSNRQHGIGH